MKRLSLALVAAVGLTSAAAAGDLPNRTYANNSYAEPSFSWAGFYAGLNVGYTWNSSDNPEVSDYYGPFGNSHVKKDGSFTGGVQAGYNFQSGSLVYGIEGDLNIGNLSRRDNSLGNYSGRWDTYAVRTETTWFGTVRPRIGFAVLDRLMIFGTGGLAFGNVKVDGSAAVGNYVLSGNTSDVRWGWTLGAGAEFAITNNLILKGEYAYVSLADRTNTWQGRYNFDALSVKDSPSFQLLRVGVNYKF